jgi:MFS family permease
VRCGIGLCFALLPLYVIHLGLDAQQSLQILAVASAGSLLFQPFAGRLIDRFTPHSVLLVSAILQVAFCAVWAHAVTSGTWVWPLMLAWGASGGAMYAACITGLGKKFSTRNLAAATTGYLMMWESGALFGPFLVGVAMDIWDPHGMAIVLALLGVVLVAVTLRRVSIV